MTNPQRAQDSRWLVVLLAALTAVLALLLPATPASAAAPPAAETRVGASTVATAVVVGVHECITAGQRPVRGPSQPQIVSGNCVAAEDGLLAQANALRDIKVADLSGASAAARTESSTVVGAYNVRTGSVGVGTSSKVLGECAEACAARAVGGDIGDVRFTQAFRPRGSGRPPTVQPVCAFCESTYGRGAFPDLQTLFQSDLG